jgi:hypothetical protein
LLLFEIDPSGTDAGSCRAGAIDNPSGRLEYITRGGGTVSWRYEISRRITGADGVSRRSIVDGGSVLPATGEERKLLAEGEEV